MKKMIVAVFVLTILIVAGISFTKNITGNAINNSDTKEFAVKAFRFGYDPNIIIVNKGDNVKINIENVDTLHGIRIPELGLKGNEVIEFTAEKTWEFTWYCANMCGNEHMQMQGKLIVK